MSTQTIDTLDAEFGRRWIRDFVATFDDFRERLSDLDRLAGDGDFGTNLNSALGRAQDAIEKADPQSFGAVLSAVSNGFLRTGGTSGPLFGMWFRELASSTSAPDAGLPGFAAGVNSGVATVMKLGKATVGDNTMVDAMVPTATALSSAVESGESLVEALRLAAVAARTGAESTAALTASRGRASYVGDLAQGVLDPGAVAVALLFQAAYNATDSAAPLDWQLA